jgi:eukaryotic translation initiation factor 2C
MGALDGRKPGNPKQIFLLKLTQSKTIDFKPLVDILAGRTTNGKVGEIIRAPISDSLPSRDEVAPPSSSTQLRKSGHTVLWLEALAVFEHVLHQHARRNQILIKKSFFPKGPADRLDYIGNAVNVARGVYASIKLAFKNFQNNTPLRSLTVNVDATTVCFWQGGSLKSVLVNYLNYGGKEPLFEVDFRKQAMGKVPWPATRLGSALSKLKNVKVIMIHLRKKGVKDREMTIHRFLPKPPSAHKFKIEKKEGRPDDPNLPPGEYTVEKYFNIKYGKRQLATLPCVELGNGNVVPIEACNVLPDQPYKHRLDPEQTGKMLRIAAQPPSQRRAAIQTGVDALDWGNDLWLKNYGLQIAGQMTKVKGRLLESPTVQFKTNTIPIKDTSAGRWRLIGAKFQRTNADLKNPIKSWGVCVINDGRGPCLGQSQTLNFANSIRYKYIEHGGSFEKGTPLVRVLTHASMGEQLHEFYKELLAKMGTPQILFFVVPDKSPDVYNNLKRICDCRYGVASQVLQSSHLKTDKINDQYLSNVCLKVNGKLGGSNGYARNQKTLSLVRKFYDPNERILILGADVTHAAPGSNGASVACLTMSQDFTFTRYMGAVETNGPRQDIIHSMQLRKLFKPMLENWMMANSGRAPKRVIYVRDGVSRELGDRVLQDEVKDLKNCLIERFSANEGSVKVAQEIRFTVIVCTKRHHVRFFPRPGTGDRNGNPLPGTLVETGCTGAVDLDWYLCSHAAIKGTARPMHYHVLLDENNFGLEELQQFIFENSFQYIRSTTPVSQFPAIYYAHLCSKRGLCHEDRALSTSSKKTIDEYRLQGMGDREAILAAEAEQRAADDGGLPDMMPVEKPLNQVMWYI